MGALRRARSGERGTRDPAWPKHARATCRCCGRCNGSVSVRGRGPTASGCPWVRRSVMMLEAAPKPKTPPTPLRPPSDPLFIPPTDTPCILFGIRVSHNTLAAAASHRPHCLRARQCCCYAERGGPGGARRQARPRRHPRGQQPGERSHTKKHSLLLHICNRGCLSPARAARAAGRRPSPHTYSSAASGVMATPDGPEAPSPSQRRL